MIGLPAGTRIWIAAGVTEMRMPATAGIEQSVSGDDSAGDDGGVDSGAGRSDVLMNSGRP